MSPDESVMSVARPPTAIFEKRRKGTESVVSCGVRCRIIMDSVAGLASDILEAVVVVKERVGCGVVGDRVRQGRSI